MLVYVALAVLLVALLGALIHPFVLLLELLPVDASTLLVTLNAVKLFIADLLFWGFLSLLATALVIILRARLAKAKTSASREVSGEGPIFREPTDHTPMRMAVALTAYDDAEAIAKMVPEFKTQEGVVEVIVVDNNSRDHTAAVAAAAGARVVREARQGYGFACMRGLREALKVSEAEVIVLTEGDGTFEARDLRKFQAYMPQADMVIGTRVVPGLVEKDSQMDPFFTWGNVFVGTLLRLRFWESQFLGASRLSDVGCTFRAVRREALELILPDLVVGGNHFSPHMMLVALARGLSIIEIPVTFRRRIGKSKGASQSLGKGLKVGLAMIWHIMTYRPTRPARYLAGGLPARRVIEVKGRSP